MRVKISSTEGFPDDFDNTFESSSPGDKEEFMIAKDRHGSDEHRPSFACHCVHM